MAKCNSEPLLYFVEQQKDIVPASELVVVKAFCVLYSASLGVESEISPLEHGLGRPRVPVRRV